VNEQNLVALLKEGDQQAYACVVDELGNAVYNTCLGLVQNAHDAEDLAQEVFVAVFKHIHSFRGEAKLSTWIYRIAITRSLEFLRTKKRKKRFALIQQLFPGTERDNTFIAPAFYHPGVKLENKERAAVLFKALDQLPENQKSAFVLHKLEELSYAEIAEVLGLSISAVESLMVRARQNLRRLLQPYYEKNEV